MYKTGDFVPNFEKKKNKWGGISTPGKERNGDDDITIIPADELLRNNGMLKTTLLLLMGNLGTGVLTIPYAFHMVGFINGCVISVFMALLTRYAAVLLSRVFLEHQDCHTMGALAERLSSPRFARFVHTGVYVYMFVKLAYWLLVAAKAIENIKTMCIYTAALWCGIVLLPLMQLRTLGDISYLGVLSLLAIVAVVVLCFQQTSYDDDVTYSMFDISSVYGFFSAIAVIGFSYCDQLVYVEIMYEMRDPKEFVCALNISFWTLFFVYTTCGVVGYWLAGDNIPAYLLDVMPAGSTRSAAAILLLMHVFITMLPKVQILTRMLHHNIDIASVDSFHCISEMFWRATTCWFLISIILFLGIFVVMNTIPYFEDFMVLMGCLFDPLINMFSPAVLFWLLLQKMDRPKSISMMITWVFLAVFLSCLMVIGTSGALSNWLANSGGIWTCNPEI